MPARPTHKAGWPRDRKGAVSLSHYKAVGRPQSIVLFPFPEPGNRRCRGRALREVRLDGYRLPTLPGVRRLALPGCLPIPPARNPAGCDRSLVGCHQGFWQTGRSPPDVDAKQPAGETGYGSPAGWPRCGSIALGSRQRPRPSRVVRRLDRPTPRGQQPPPAAPRRRDGDSAPAVPIGRILTTRARSHVLPSPEERRFPRSPGSRVVGDSTRPGVFRCRARRAHRGDARAIRPHTAGGPARSGPPVRAERWSSCASFPPSCASFPPSCSRECVGDAPAIDRPLDAAPDSGNNPVGAGTGWEQPVARTPGLGGTRDASIPPV